MASFEPACTTRTCNGARSFASPTCSALARLGDAIGTNGSGWRIFARVAHFRCRYGTRQDFYEPRSGSELWE